VGVGLGGAAGLAFFGLAALKTPRAPSSSGWGGGGGDFTKYRFETQWF